jgi:hypothetical protein
MDHCIENNIMADYFNKNRDEVLKMYVDAVEYANYLMEKGRQEIITETVKNMLSKNCSLEFISDIMFLSISKIELIAKTIH